jgi:hypothetical protein
MPITLARIAANTATVSIDFGGGNVLNVEYYPLRITTEMFAQMQGFAEANEATVMQKFEEICAMLVTIVKSWDLLEDDEVTPVPLTVERVKRISPVITMQIISAIGQNINPETIAPQTKRNGQA